MEEIWKLCIGSLTLGTKIVYLVLHSEAMKIFTDAKNELAKIKKGDCIY